MTASPDSMPAIVVRHDLGRTVALVVWIGAVAVIASEWIPDVSILLSALGVGGIVWVVGWRPAVVVDDAAVTVRNPVRDVRIGWASVEDSGFDWSLWLRAGDVTVRAAAAPGPASMGALYDRRRTSSGILERRGIADVAAGRRLPPALLAVRQRWAAQAHVASAEVMVSRPWMSVIVLGASCLALVGVVVTG